MAFVPSPPFCAPLRSSPSISVSRKPSSTPRLRRAFIMSSTVVEHGAGMRKIAQADEETIKKMGCRDWGKWGCEASTFPWSYDDDEVCLVLEGDFTVIPDGGGESMDVKAGDIAFFPKGMSCTWEVRSKLDKHFAFGVKL